MSNSPRIGLWDVYQQMANPLIVEDGDSWKDLTIRDLYDLLMQEQKTEVPPK